MNRSTWLRLGALTVALALPAGSALAAPAPGAPGGGDPYYPLYGNGGYDVNHYAVNVEYDRASNIVNGRTEISARATQDLSRFNLDLALRAKLVTVNNRPARFTQTERELVITPQTPVAKDRNMTVNITYRGNPATTKVDGFSPWILTPTGAVALGEPESAAWWFPSNDHPKDKATYDINVTVPKDVEALSNGILESSTVVGDRRVWRWREANPMASYLAFFATGQYAVSRGTWKGKPLINAVETGGGERGSRAARDFARTGEVLDFLERQFGPYPFGAVGNVAPNADIGFALENQTRPVYSNRFWRSGPNMYVVVHEQAHQWFGDSVSVQRWRDIWLNEGFASYAEWLWSEAEGEGTRQDHFDAVYLTPADSPFWKVKIGNPGPDNQFDGAVYNRGAMTVQALRNRIGEQKMQTLLRTWVQQKKHGNATVEEFMALAEQVSGQQLDSFFTAWLFTGRRPAPTAENGFPAGYPQVGTQRKAAPRSKAVIDANTALRVQQHHHG